MRLALSTITVLLIGISFVLAQSKDQCLTCHTDSDDPPAKKYINDVHYKKGISCVDCHGGDSSKEDMEEGMDPAKGFIGIPKGLGVTETCLKCHGNSQIMTKFKSLIDTEQFQQFTKSVHGPADVTTCIRCHGIHEIRSPKDPLSPVYPTREVQLCSGCHGNANYMKKFNPTLATDQLEKYKTSVHGQLLEKGDMKVATCSDCHASHRIFAPQDPRSTVYALNVPKTCAHCHSNAAYMKPYGIPTDQYQEFVSSVHGEALLKKRDTAAPACNDCHGNHGAAPPEVLSISHVCGNCHALNAEYFAKSRHASAYEEMGIPQCEICHGNHGVKVPTDAMLNVGYSSVCESCHAPNDKGYEAGRQMYKMIQDLKRQSAVANQQLEMAERKGMDVSDAQFKAKDIPGALIKARTVLHTFHPSDVKKEIDAGLLLSREVTQAGKQAIEEYSFRRKGLGVSTLFITLLAIALYLKIRQIESK